MKVLLKVVGVMKEKGLACKNDGDIIYVKSGIPTMDLIKWLTFPESIVGKKIVIETLSGHKDVENGDILFPIFKGVYDNQEEDVKMKFIAEVVDKELSTQFHKQYKLVEIEAFDKEAARRICIGRYGSPKRLFEAEEVETRSEMDMSIEVIFEKLKGVMQDMRPTLQEIRDNRRRNRMEPPSEFEYNFIDAHKDVFSAMDRLRRAGRALRNKDRDE